MRENRLVGAWAAAALRGEALDGLDGKAWAHLLRALDRLRRHPIMVASPEVGVWISTLLMLSEIESDKQSPGAFKAWSAGRQAIANDKRRQQAVARRRAKGDTTRGAVLAVAMEDNGPTYGRYKRIALQVKQRFELDLSTEYIRSILSK